MAETENSAQANARSEVVSSTDLPSDSDLPQRDQLPEDESRISTGELDDHSHRTDDESVRGPDTAGSDEPPEHGRVVSEPSGEQPSIDELRAELNEQFESIKILSPGQYELNLMELYNREEYIISLQEDGRYVIDVPDSWRADEDE